MTNGDDSSAAYRRARMQLMSLFDPVREIERQRDRETERGREVVEGLNMPVNIRMQCVARLTFTPNK
jgi:hypothetical protein